MHGMADHSGRTDAREKGGWGKKGIGVTREGRRQFGKFCKRKRRERNFGSVPSLFLSLSLLRSLPLLRCRFFEECGWVLCYIIYHDD